MKTICGINWNRYLMRFNVPLIAIWFTFNCKILKCLNQIVIFLKKPKNDDVFTQNTINVIIFKQQLWVLVYISKYKQKKLWELVWNELWARLNGCCFSTGDNNQSQILFFCFYLFFHFVSFSIAFFLFSLFLIHLSFFLSFRLFILCIFLPFYLFLIFSFLFLLYVFFSFLFFLCVFFSFLVFSNQSMSVGTCVKRMESCWAVAPDSSNAKKTRKWKWKWKRIF